MNELMLNLPHSITNVGPIIIVIIIVIISFTHM